MATLSRIESKRMYSWWWDSHISPKNSKWLQENLAEMDRNIKAMIKLIEEDADSFARRAEMYYRKRPELIKIVEEFYRAYRALAERYDNATGALCQAQQTIAEAFPDRVPSIFAKESPSPSFDTEFRPRTPEMALHTRALFDPEGMHKDDFVASSQFQVICWDGAYVEDNDLKKGLKQLNHMFPTEEGKACSMSSEGKLRKVLIFNEEDIRERGELKVEMKWLQEEISELANRNAALERQMASETECFQNLEVTLSKLKAEKESALLQHKLSEKSICCLEAQISTARYEFNNIKDEMLVKLNCAEERSLLLEKENQSLYLELEAQGKELRKRVRELEELNSSIQDENQKRMHTEVALASMEDIHYHTQREAEHLTLEVQTVVKNFKDMELSKADLDKEVSELTDIIIALKEQNISYDLRINELQDERQLLMESKMALETDLYLHVAEKRACQEEISCLMKDKNDLQRKHQALIEQMELVSYQKEVSDRSLSDANIELDALREKVQALEASCETLLGEVTNHVAEKAVLVCQTETLSQNMDKLSGKRAFLENSLSDVNTELENSRKKFRNLEESWEILYHQNSNLLDEKNTLLFQVENLENKNSELEKKLSNLENEKDAMVHHARELESSLGLQVQGYEARLLSSNKDRASLGKKINLLEDECRVCQEVFEAEYQISLKSQIEAYILKRCVYDMKDTYSVLSGECQKHLEASKCSEKLISQLEHKITSLMGYYYKLRDGILVLLKELDIKEYGSIDRTKEEVVVQTILEALTNLLQSISEDRDENQQLQLETDILVTLLNQVGMEKNRLHHELENRTKEASLFQIRKDELQAMNDKQKSENNILYSQVESIQDNVNNVEIGHMELKDQQLCLDKGKNSTIHEAMELLTCLREESQERDASRLSSKSHLASLESQDCLLLEEQRAKAYEIEQEKEISTVHEGFVLQDCLHDMKDKDLILFRDYHKLLEESLCSAKIFSQLQRKDFVQKKQMSLILEYNATLKEGILILLKELNRRHWNNEGAADEDLLQIILNETKNLLNSLSSTQDGDRYLHLEILGLISFIKKIGLENFHVKFEFAGQREEALALERKKDEAIEMNEKINSGTQSLAKELTDLHDAHQVSQSRSSNLLEETWWYLSKRSDNTREEKEALEDENHELLAEIMMLDHLYIYFRSLSSEKLLELESMSDNIFRLLAVKNDLNEEIRGQNERMRELEVEIMHLKDSVVVREFDLNLTSNFCKECELHIKTGEHLLNRKDMELSAALEKNAELCKKLDGSRKELNGAKVVREELEKEISTLVECNNYKDKQIISLCRENELLCKERDSLNCEIGLHRREGCLWEGEVGSLLNDMQTAAVNAACFEEKATELNAVCEHLESHAMVQKEKLCEEILSDGCLDQLKKRYEDLEEENRELKANLNASLPLVASLSSGIESLEEHILSLSRHQRQIKMTSHVLSEEDSDPAVVRFPELKKLVVKVEALRDVIMETERLLLQERQGAIANLEATRKETEELRLQLSSAHQNSKERFGKTKDIQLDQVASCHAGSYGLNKISNSELDDQLLELWETAEIDNGEVVEEARSEHPSSELVTEKEQSIDKLKVSIKVKESPQAWNRKIIDILGSDAQKLSILQKSLQELRVKWETLDKKKHVKTVEHVNLKMQLRELEEAISEQVVINVRLKKRVEDRLISSNFPVGEVEQRQVSESVRRGSERIEKLELELQKIEYILLKLQEENRRSGHSHKKASIILRGCIYGRKEVSGKKKRRFCGCMRPKTKD